MAKHGHASCRMNGSTGPKMQKLFEALVPKLVHKDARNLVEYCCFRFLSRDNSDFHPCLQVSVSRFLMLIIMSFSLHFLDYLCIVFSWAENIFP